MKAQYLIRFDDCCPTMNWPVWVEVERALLEFDVNPIMSVVPDNRDTELEVNEPKRDFWSEVRGWQLRGWTIGLHGYQHRYVTRDAGLVGINKCSEFSALSLEDQSHKMRRSLDIFERERVKADVWVAPGHSFDETTLRALRSVGIKRISDGLFPFPCMDSSGVLWVPQQLWRFRHMPVGVWTICCHINRWTPRDIQKFCMNLRRFRQAITNFSEVIAAYSKREKTRFDDFYARLHLGALRTSRFGFLPLLRRAIWG
jgi:predicted deacetylase